MPRCWACGYPVYGGRCGCPVRPNPKAWIALEVRDAIRKHRTPRALAFPNRSATEGGQRDDA